MIPISTWQRLSASNFEELALEHVRDLYPDFSWRCTSFTQDGGKDGIGELRDVHDGISEIYWMEAKHHPAKRSIGQYTLDTHLVSAFFSRTVRRLHVVTSGTLSSNFILRAHLFSTQHGFGFAYTDREGLEAWMVSRIDIIDRYFGAEAALLREILDTSQTTQPVFARALLLPENDTLGAAIAPVTSLVPGRKFRLVVMLSIGYRIPSERIPLRLRWSPPVDRISLLTNAGLDGLPFDPTRDAVVSVPFRLLKFSREPLPCPVIVFADDVELTSAELRRVEDLPRLISPFVGKHARTTLIRLKRHLRDDVSNGRPRLVVCRGRAGAGKTRLCEELRDDAQSLGFTVRLLEMTSTPWAQEDRWRLLFRWLLGLEHNPFYLPEERVIDNQLAGLECMAGEESALLCQIRAFLLQGEFSEDLFNLDLPAGRRMSMIVHDAISRRWGAPVLLHIDDAHHLSRRQLRPLYLLRHLVETVDGLPLCIVVTSRNDETVRDTSFEHFVSGLELAGFSGFEIIDLPDLDSADARELVTTTLHWPELLAEESRTLQLIIDRAGVNPFVLMQTLDHLAVDRGTVVFGHGESGFLVDAPAFKQALAETPAGVDKILEQRFNGLRALKKRNLLLTLAAVAILGRSAPRSVVTRTLGHRISAKTLDQLVRYGYLRGSGEQLELAHDLLSEALQRRPEAREVAIRMARELEEKGRMAVGEDEAAAIYFAAGPRYYRRSWVATGHLINERFERQEYLGLPPLLTRLDRISSRVRSLVVNPQLRWVSAVVDQHCGNTYKALQKFREIQQFAAFSLPESSELYVDATIEIGNQNFLRCQPISACEALEEALAALQRINVPKTTRSRLLALAHNRYGANLHFLGRSSQALEHFQMALRWATDARDDYLLSHTYWNLAALLRFSQPADSRHHLQEARHIWREQLRSKDRLRIMLDCSEAYSQCLDENDFHNRRRLLAVAAEAFEKGYLFQACSTLLCLAYCALLGARWSDAKYSLLRALDLTTVAEDLKHRAYVAHYLAVCAHMDGALTETRDWTWQALTVLGDPGVRGTTLYHCTHYNDRIAAGEADVEPPVGLSSANGLYWVPYDRA